MPSFSSKTYFYNYTYVENNLYLHHSNIIRPTTTYLARENMPSEPTKQANPSSEPTQQPNPSSEDQTTTKQTFLPIFENDPPAPKHTEKRVAEPEEQGKPKTAQVFLSNSDEEDQAPPKEPEPEAISEAEHHEPAEPLPQQGKSEN
ncbi:unnamed protein product [Clonostachys byssicola]|uniref:Uncharacterized protein n=1 Tax=Clonostachys byssicola TaxID=160290 RepID=A0A9N9U2T5_9HYPO|nr:unnamed protein product [Clonostachys byssicola]